MKPPKPTKPLPDRAEKVRLARLRLAKAEHQLATAKAQSQLARQRRKEAKQAARAAKKVARLAKVRVERAEATLARLEARMAQAPRAPFKGRSRKTPAKKTTVIQRRIRPLDAVVLRAPAGSAIKKPAARRVKAKPAVNLIMAAANVVSPVLSELETPVEVLPISEHKPTPEIVKGVEEIFTDETGTPENPAPATETSTLTESPATPSTVNA